MRKLIRLLSSVSANETGHVDWLVELLLGEVGLHDVLRLYSSSVVRRDDYRGSRTALVHVAG